MSDTLNKRSTALSSSKDCTIWCNDRVMGARDTAQLRAADRPRRSCRSAVPGSSLVARSLMLRIMDHEGTRAPQMELSPRSSSLASTSMLMSPREQPRSPGAPPQRRGFLLPAAGIPVLQVTAAGGDQACAWRLHPRGVLFARCFMLISVLSLRRSFSSRVRICHSYPQPPLDANAARA